MLRNAENAANAADVEAGGVRPVESRARNVTAVAIAEEQNSGLNTAVASAKGQTSALLAQLSTLLRLHPGVRVTSERRELATHCHSQRRGSDKETRGDNYPPKRSNLSR